MQREALRMQRRGRQRRGRRWGSGQQGAAKQVAVALHLLPQSGAPLAHPMWQPPCMVHLAEQGMGGGVGVLEVALNRPGMGSVEVQGLLPPLPLQGAGARMGRLWRVSAISRGVLMGRHRTKR
jgi:hypothetical protein